MDRYPATDYGMSYGQMDYGGSGQYGVPVGPLFVGNLKHFVQTDDYTRREL